MMKVYGFCAGGKRYVMAAKSKAALSACLEPYGLRLSHWSLARHVCETGNEQELKALKAPCALLESRDGALFLVRRIRRSDGSSTLSKAETKEKGA